MSMLWRLLPSAAVAAVVLVLAEQQLEQVALGGYEAAVAAQGRRLHAAVGADQVSAAVEAGDQGTALAAPVGTEGPEAESSS